MIVALSIIAAVLFSDGAVKIEGEERIDLSRVSVVTVTPKGIDIRDRFRGFTVADDYDDDKRNCTRWKLYPEPCAKDYRIAAFAYDGKVVGPVKFLPPAERESVTGDMEVNPRRDLPPLSWKLVGWCALALSGAALFGWLVFVLLCKLVRRVKEYRMSPIERAWAELDRLIRKGLPGRGRYKDFYVELTMVVRRYIQRKYGIRAPHLTTEEFLREAKPSDELKRFLESADMVKFAGVEATPAMADEATESARGYLRGDDASTEVKK